MADRGLGDDPPGPLPPEVEAWLGSCIAGLVSQLALCLAETGAEVDGFGEPPKPTDLPAQLRRLAAVVRAAEARLRRLAAVAEAPPGGPLRQHRPTTLRTESACHVGHDQHPDPQPSTATVQNIPLPDTPLSPPRRSHAPPLTPLGGAAAPPPFPSFAEVTCPDNPQAGGQSLDAIAEARCDGLAKPLELTNGSDLVPGSVPRPPCTGKVAGETAGATQTSEPAVQSPNHSLSVVGAERKVPATGSLSRRRPGALRPGPFPADALDGCCTAWIVRMWSVFKRWFGFEWLLTLRRRSESMLEMSPRQGSLRAQSDQQRMHQEGIFWAVKEGLRDRVRQLVAEDPAVLTQPDAVGASPIHVAFLYWQTEIGKALVEEFPKLATSVYGEGEYSGESVLHIAIIHQDVELVQWLLDRHPELLNAETTGSFFAPSGDVYFGGLPLLFAVSSNQVDILRCILATRIADDPRDDLKNQITVADRFGNSALHMAVIQDLPEMYDLVVEEMLRDGLSAAEVRRLLNAEGLTPLALAAAMGQDRMFQHILAKSSVIAWDYGPITCKLFPLGGLEQPFLHPESQDPIRTAIGCLCAGAQSPVTQCLKMVDSRIPRPVQQARLDLIVSAEVRQVLDKKWDAFGQRMFYRKLAVALGTVLAWTATNIVPNHYGCVGYWEAEHPIAHAAIQALEVLVLLSTGWRGIGTMWNACLPSNRSVEIHGAALFEVTLGNVFCGLYLMSLVFRLSELPGLVDVTAAFGALTGWLHVFFFLLGFRSTGPFVIMIKEMLQYDVRRFLSVIVALLLGFTVALYRLTVSPEQCGLEAFADRLWQLVLLGLVGDFPFREYHEHFSGGRMMLIGLLFTLYIILVVILLLNLLIAMMGNTYAAVQEQAEKRWYLERANLMAAYEAEHTVEAMQELRKAYATPFGQPDAAVTPDTEFCLTTTLRSEEWKTPRRPSLFSSDRFSC